MFLPSTRSGWLRFAFTFVALSGLAHLNPVHGQFMGSSGSSMGGSSMGSSGSGSFGGGGSGGSGGGGEFINQQQMDVTKFTTWSSSFDTSNSNSRSRGASGGTGSTSILGSAYKSVLGQGLPSPQLNLGQSIYNTSTGAGMGGAGGSRGGTTSRGGRTSTMGGMGGNMGRGSGSGMGGTGTSFTGMANSGTSRVSAYLTEPIFDMPQRQFQGQGIVSPKTQTEIQEVLSRSPRFQGENAIIVSNDGPAVVLRGKVASARERRIAESMARLTPGVRQVVNELEVAGSPE